MFKTVVKVHPVRSSTPPTARATSSSESCSSFDECAASSSESSSSSSIGIDNTDIAKDDTRPFRATPLSTKEILGIIGFLAIFSFIYLAYAQHHKTLFYVMTSLIALWIMFIYAAGILCVLYMVIIGYERKPQPDDDIEKDDVGSVEHQESKL
ncbi:hypothetical protein OSTOST_19908 [Ostertagia ostertagi]